MPVREPLSSVDAAWLRMEDSANLMMVTGLLRFDRPLDPRRLRSTLEARLLPFKRFRQRVVSGPLGLGLPSWEIDQRFDLSSHVHRVALPAPGDDAALQDLVSDLLSTPLDFSKPLWQVHLIEGYGGGCALVARIHHCIADGISLVGLMLSLTDEEAKPRRRARTVPQEPSDNGVNKIRSAIRDGLEMVTDPARVLKLAGDVGSGAVTLGRLLTMPGDPRTSLRGQLGVRKRAAWSPEIHLADVKQIGRWVGGTVNDVLLTAAAGAMRRYLVSRGESVPEDLSLRAAVPVNLRSISAGPLGAQAQLGNSFGLVFLDLPIGIADPFARLVELKRRMDRIKSSSEAVLVLGALGAVGWLPGPVQGLAVDFLGSKVSAVMSNVPGPREHRFLAGRQIGSVMFWVPLSGHVGLGVSIFSYAGNVMVGVVADSSLVSNPGQVTAAFETEIRELREDVILPPSRSTRRHRPYTAATSSAKAD